MFLMLSQLLLDNADLILTQSIDKCLANSKSLSLQNNASHHKTNYSHFMSTKFVSNKYLIYKANLDYWKVLNVITVFNRLSYSN